MMRYKLLILPIAFLISACDDFPNESDFTSLSDKYDYCTMKNYKPSYCYSSRYITGQVFKKVGFCHTSKALNNLICKEYINSDLYFDDIEEFKRCSNTKYDIRCNMLEKEFNDLKEIL